MAQAFKKGEIRIVTTSTYDTVVGGPIPAKISSGLPSFSSFFGEPPDPPPPTNDNGGGSKGNGKKNPESDESILVDPPKKEDEQELTLVPGNLNPTFLERNMNAILNLSLAILAAVIALEIYLI